MIFTDRLSRWVEAAALPPIDGPSVARAFYDEIITRHVFPRKVQKDKGTNFLGAMFTELNDTLKIKSLPQRPIDRNVERTCRMLQRHPGYSLDHELKEESGQMGRLSVFHSV